MRGRWGWGGSGLPGRPTRVRRRRWRAGWELTGWCVVHDNSSMKKFVLTNGLWSICHVENVESRARGSNRHVLPLMHWITPTGYREPLMYNLSVARELLKQVYVAERLAPPTSLSTITSAYQTLWARASNPGYWREILKNGEWQRVGVYAVEAYGIFKVCTRRRLESSDRTASN